MTPTKTLAIEAAIGGGSLALLDQDKVIAKWHGDGTRARSEELLLRIAELIDQSGTRKQELVRIAVSRGPGSYTGIRIGLATAMGLAKSLDIVCVGISALRSLAVAGDGDFPKVAAVPLARGGYCWQTFFDRESSEPISTGDIDALYADISSSDNTLVADSSVYKALADFEGIASLQGVDSAGLDLAECVGLASLSFEESLQPLYARDTAVAGPSRG